MSCTQCTDPDGIPCFPQYGIGPHSHLSPVTFGRTVLAEQLAPGFTPNPKEPDMGWWWCPYCGDGKPDSQPPQGDKQ